VAAVTQILEAEGVDPKLAKACAEEAQCHIGMARRLATSSEARSRRRETLMVALAIDSVTSAVNAAQRWLDIAKKDADALTEERDSQEKAALLKSLGLAEGDSIPPALRVDLKNLEENQKRRATRSLRDGIDRILVDLLSVYRDVLNIQLKAEAPLVNSALRFSIDELAESTKPEQTISKLEKIAETRHYVDSNVRDLLALEGLAVALIGPKK
jgi:DNA polymerase-3 subunit delta'